MLGALQMAAALDYIILRAKLEPMKVAVPTVIKKYRRIGGPHFRISKRSVLRWAQGIKVTPASVVKPSRNGTNLAPSRRRR